MASRKRYVILTPFNKPDIVAGIAKLHGVQADVVPTESGVVLVRDIPVPVFDDWDIAELLGDMPDMSGEGGDGAAALLRDDAASYVTEGDAHAVDGESAGAGGASASGAAAPDDAEAEIDSDNALAVAAVFSQLSPYGVVLFQVDLGDDVGGEEGVSGLVNAQRVVAGKLGEELPGGLLLNTLSTELEQIVLGLVPLEEISAHVIRASQAEAVLNQMFAGSKGDAGKEQAVQPSTSTCSPREQLAREEAERPDLYDDHVSNADYCSSISSSIAPADESSDEPLDEGVSGGMDASGGVDNQGNLQ